MWLILILKYGFCMKLLLSECNSDQLNISWPFFSSLLGGFGVALLLHPPKSDDKNGQEMFNWSELHLERSNFLQSLYFTILRKNDISFIKKNKVTAKSEVGIFNTFSLHYITKLF